MQVEINKSFSSNFVQPNPSFSNQGESFRTQLVEIQNLQRHTERLGSTQLSCPMGRSAFSLREQGIMTKQAARDLNIPVERARNWYYKDTGMTALDLLRMMEKYEFIRQAVESSLSL